MLFQTVTDHACLSDRYVIRHILCENSTETIHRQVIFGKYIDGLERSQLPNLGNGLERSQIE